MIRNGSASKNLVDLLPLFDKYALKSHNDLINDGNIEIFETSDKGIVNTNTKEIDNYDFYYKEKKVSWTTLDEVRNRTKQAVKKGKILFDQT